MLKSVQTRSLLTAESDYWAGQAAAKTCPLCKEQDEGSDHFWRCRALEKERLEIDEEIATVNPDVFPAALRHGIAPALAAGCQQHVVMIDNDSPQESTDTYTSMY